MEKVGSYINKYNLTILTMIETIKVSSRGQVVIPESMRDDLNIKEGTKLVVIEKGKKLILELEKDFLKKLEKMELEKEKLGWLALAEKSLIKTWDNSKDEKAWGRYL